MAPFSSFIWLCMLVLCLCLYPQYVEAEASFPPMMGHDEANHSVIDNWHHPGHHGHRDHDHHEHEHEHNHDDGHNDDQPETFAEGKESVHFFPPLDYIPHPVGIPFSVQNDSMKPWEHVHPNPSPISHKTLMTGGQCSASQSGSGAPAGQYWYEQVEHNGESSFLNWEYKELYKVFRNGVDDYGADNTGTTDASDAIQRAIEEGPVDGPTRDSHSMGSTGQPAIIYLPGGTYRIEKGLQLYIGTVIVGDPTNPPVLKASSKFDNDHVIYSKDPNFGGTINFYIGIKNVVIDSTTVDPNRRLVLLDWTVSQATQLGNVVFRMPQGAEGHIGLTTEFAYNSNIIVNDLVFQGGNIGMTLSGQQWVFKGLTFQGTKTGIVTGGTDIVFLGCQFQNGKLGIDASGTSGSLTVIDSTGSGMETFIVSGSSGTAANSIILDNVQNSGTTVNLAGDKVLTGNVWNTWVHGNLYTPGNPSPQHDEGRLGPTNRAQPLLSGNKFATVKQPTYQEYSANQVVNIKSVDGTPVYGDGTTDDTTNINTILSMHAGCKLIYFPAGTYIVTDTIIVPAGTRIIGDSFASTISGVGSKFMNEHSPRAMVRIGYPGDTGVAQMSDMMFTVADVLPGCKMVEVNMAGNKPGDVGLWNTHFRIGGAVGSQVQTKCTGSPTDCKAAWGLLHLTSSSSAYIENMWGWTADHDLDGHNKQNIATGRGLLVEATKGTWLVGTGFEHHTLYQYNFHRAQNVFSAMQQSETPYWQGPGAAPAPQPWDGSLTSLDPHFDHCGANDSLCRMGFFELIRHSSNLYLYGGCNWVFFNNNGGCDGDQCQENAIDIAESSQVYLYGTNTKSMANIVLEGAKVIAKESDNAGGWGGVVAAYLYDV